MRKVKGINYITETEVADTVKGITRGEFFQMTYRKKDGTLRKATCQRGVSNPATANKPNGTGLSADDALKQGVVKYYEAFHKNDDGTTTGEYRSAKVERILSMKIKGNIFIIDHTNNNNNNR